MKSLRRKGHYFRRPASVNDKSKYFLKSTRALARIHRPRAYARIKKWIAPSSRERTADRMATRARWSTAHGRRVVLSRACRFSGARLEGPQVAAISYPEWAELAKSLGQRKFVARYEGFFLLSTDDTLELQTVMQTQSLSGPKPKGSLSRQSFEVLPVAKAEDGEKLRRSVGRRAPATSRSSIHRSPRSTRI